MSGAAGIIAGGHGGSISIKELLVILGVSSGIIITVILVLLGARG